MSHRLTKFFMPPVFEDEEKTRIANLLSATLLTLVLVGLARVILAFAATPLYLTVTLRGNASLIIVTVAMFALMRFGHVRPACIAFTVYQWSALAFVTGYYGGVRLSIYGFFVFVILAAGLLLGGRWAIGYAVLTVVYGTVLLYLESQGLISATPQTTLEIFSTVTPSFITTAVLVYLYRRDITRALTRAQQHAIEITNANEQLSHEISARKQAEEKLFLAQKMEAIGRLSGGIAHDFNNLLVPIVGYVELALMSEPDDSDIHDHLLQIKEAAGRATELIQQIKAFGRQQVLEVDIIDLNETVRNFRPIIQQLLREDIDLETVLSTELYAIRADKMQIEQILMNLIVNARDAMPDGGRLIIETKNLFLNEEDARKHLDTKTPGAYVLLTVSDTGQGMDAEITKHVFEPFFTTKERDQGTGLGLPTVFGIVKQHKGNIWIYSEPDQGTTIKIYLPADEDSLPTEAISAPDSTIATGTETIMVAEDEDAVRELVCDTLRSHGYHVLEAPNPRECLELADNGKDTIHLLLTDVIMPEMNGRELYQKMAAQRPNLKVLYMSGYTNNVIDRHGILEEGIVFLPKPFTMAALTQKVRQALEKNSS